MFFCTWQHLTSLYLGGYSRWHSKVAGVGLVARWVTKGLNNIESELMSLMYIQIKATWWLPATAFCNIVIHGEGFLMMAMMIVQSQWLSAILRFLEFTLNISQTQLSLSLHQWASEVCLWTFYCTIGEIHLLFRIKQICGTKPLQWILCSY